MKTKEQIRDDYEFLRAGYDASVFRLVALGLTEVEADDLLHPRKPRKQPNSENRLRLMEGGLG